MIKHKKVYGILLILALLTIGASQIRIYKAKDAFLETKENRERIVESNWDLLSEPIFTEVNNAIYKGLFSCSISDSTFPNIGISKTEEKLTIIESLNRLGYSVNVYDAYSYGYFTPEIPEDRELIYTIYWDEAAVKKRRLNWYHVNFMGAREQ